MSGTAPPVNVDVPYASQNGDLLNCTMGNWEGEPTGYAYQWNDGTAAVGTDNANYVLQQPADVGKSFSCVVTATNAGGSTAAPPSNAVVATAAEPGSGVPPGSGAPPAGATDPVPPTQEQIARAFKAVRQQAKFRDNRAKALAGCEHINEGLQEALVFCSQPDAADHLAEITERVNWSIDHVGELRAAVEAAELPAPPEPPDPTVALTQDQVDAGKRIVNAARALTELRTNSLSQCDEVGTTLQICLQWCSEPDATDHMVEIAAGVNGAIEQMARLRSSFGSTQTVSKTPAVQTIQSQGAGGQTQSQSMAGQQARGQTDQTRHDQRVPA